MTGMLKLTKKADYGLIAMKHLAEHGSHASCSAKDLADAYNLPQEAIAKILQRLAKAKLVIPQRGTNGGYTLSRDPATVSAFEVIQAIEGPLFITSCVTERGTCGQSVRCTVREPLQRVSRSIEDVLTQITISELARKSEDESPELVSIEQAEKDHE
jgi:FeS assembly SUF system regulator